MPAGEVVAILEADERARWSPDVPVYEYRCLKKKHRFEVLQRMSEDPVENCEVCGAPAQRVLFAPAIHFKGSGFHNTDYGTKKRPRDDSGGSSDAGTSKDGAKDGAAKDSAGSSNGNGDGPKVKEATPSDTAARATGP